MTEARKTMVQEQIKDRGITDPAVLEAMSSVERHRFVSPALKHLAYTDQPLPIAHNQTISQPFIVAHMTQLLDPQPDDRVLEIGTGCGYQAAVLAEIVSQVYTIEIIPELAETARDKLNDLGYGNITVRLGDGYQGWTEHAPFDKIIVTAAPPTVPEALIKQLKIGGKMVIPVGTTEGFSSQELLLIRKTTDGIEQRSLAPVRFVPMVPGKTYE
ncbi:MAG: protein-L-isoaspartate(D-aspartate) O-methyltransferase [Candidatus Omnitrophota bacterium]